MTTDVIADVVSGRIALPTVARVVQQLIADLRRSDVSSHRIAGLLAQDPVLAARTLRLANSPYYCGRRTLASIDDAVAAIGTDALRMLVVTCGVASAFVEVPTVNLRQFWVEAVTTATAARLALRHAGCAAPDTIEAAYAAGLLLETGHLILCQAQPAAATAAFTRYANLRGAALAEVELAAFGMAHPAVGALWVDALGFPNEIGRAIAQRFDPEATRSEIGAALHLGAQLCASALDGLPCAAAVALLDADAVDHLQLAEPMGGKAFRDEYVRLQGMEWMQ